MTEEKLFDLFTALREVPARHWRQVGIDAPDFGRDVAKIIAASGLAFGTLHSGRLASSGERTKLRSESAQILSGDNMREEIAGMKKTYTTECVVLAVVAMPSMAFAENEPVTPRFLAFHAAFAPCMSRASCLGRNRSTNDLVARITVEIYAAQRLVRRATTTTWRATGSPISRGSMPANHPGRFPVHCHREAFM